MMGIGAGKAKEIPGVFLSPDGVGKKIVVENGQVVFRQGDTSDAVYLVLSGRIRISVASVGGKEATVAILGPHELFGETCLLFGRKRRVTSASALGSAEILKVELVTVNALLKKDPELADFVLKHVIARMAQYEQALVHQILNNVERRLARALLHLSKYDSTNAKPVVIQDVSQEMLAGMIGASRSKINGFMTKFRRLGYIEYSGRRVLVNPSLVSVLLQPKAQAAQARGEA
jgi:CRP/FNR family cyclic AMP-dependent transcriptional regulator